MALDDPNQDRAKFNRARERIKVAEIDDTDRAALLAFMGHKDEKNAKSTAHKQANYALRCAEIAHEKGEPPLTQWTQGDYRRFHSRLKNARPDNNEVPGRFLERCGSDGWGEGSLRQFRNALKQLLLFIGGEDDDREWTDDDDRDWADDIKIGKPPKPKVDAYDLLRPDELAAMWTAVDNDRDRAMFALTYCTWQRNAVVRSFRIGDFETFSDGVEGVVRIYEDAHGRKGASGRKPVSWAVGPVSDWIAVHPRSDDPDATILCQDNDAGSAERGEPFTNGNAINRRLQTIAKRAGLDRERWDRDSGRKQRTVRAHLLRYTGATRAAKSDEFSESTVKKWGGWTQSSKQLDRYIQLTDDDVLASWAAAHDINSSAFGSERPEFGNCSRCDGPVEDWLPICPSCGHEIGEEFERGDVVEGTMWSDEELDRRMAATFVGALHHFRDQGADLGDLGGMLTDDVNADAEGLVDAMAGHRQALETDQEDIRRAADVETEP